MSSREIRDKSNLFLYLLIALNDALMLLFAYLIEFILLDILQKKQTTSIIPSHPFFYTYLVIFIIMVYCMDLYVISSIRKNDIILSILIANIVSTIGTIIIDSIFSSGNNGVYIALYLLLALPITLIFRLLLNRIIGNSKEYPTLLVIEAKNVDNAFVRKIKYSSLSSFNSWYIQVDFDDEQEFEEFMSQVLVNYNNIFITQSVPEDKRKHIIQESINLGKSVYISPSYYDVKISKYELVQFDDVLSFRIKPFSLSKGAKLLKRIFDIVVSLAGLIITLPITIIAAVAIKLDSAGSVFYTQDRVTRDGRVFKVYKFRTMVSDAEKMSGPVLAKDNDPRITKVGRILRTARLDELPQLINVFLGDMSIVGPRPERVEFVEKYSKEIENYNVRHLMKAGLTGYAQVYARYNTDAKDKLLYDLMYIHEYSFWLDIKIIILTLKILFTSEAAEGIKEEPYNSNKKDENSKIQT